ncbi:hypothetical protein K402DRAFT_117664 [Aulographum hederae CBS 113979]|uniref:Uncharacterized protein n=1 Tax=Aulographum hederae CBS 113979 TaxID=1176131 RepID=A0A6G1GW95_9PEZI|nr:hypothetical protein K402DRAFT_117664 [Aulographum hederae CBS 113979]
MMAAAADNSPLNKIPPDIEKHRQLCFALDTPVQFTTAVFEKYWPFVDNVWSMHQRHHEPAQNGIKKEYGACRLYRRANRAHAAKRAKKQREGTGTCPAKFRVTVYPDGLRVLERNGDEKHSHTLDYIDSIKRCSFLRSMPLDNFFKGWEAAGIMAYLRDNSHTPDGRDILKDAGGLYLTRKEVLNVIQGAVKKAHKGQDLTTVKTNTNHSPYAATKAATHSHSPTRKIS